MSKIKKKKKYNINIVGVVLCSHDLFVKIKIKEITINIETLIDNKQSKLSLNKKCIE